MVRGRRRRDLATGYRFGMGGEIEGSVKASQSIGVKLPIAALIIVLLLVTQFNSIRRTGANETSEPAPRRLARSVSRLATTTRS